MNMKNAAFKAADTLILAALMIAPALVEAQIEILSDTRSNAEIAKLPVLEKDAKSASLRTHIAHAAQAAKTKTGRDGAIVAARVANDFKNADDAPFLHYAVPAMSDNQRLPNVYPFDGQPGDTVRIIAAKGEFEPGSFLVYPLSNLGKVSFTLTPFRTSDGKVFPADKLDLKVVKVWYQNKNAWYSYFGDTDFKLVPELLLNDEDLIRVDTNKAANYARITGDDGKNVERWINPPRQLNERFFDHYRSTQVFAPMKKGFEDAKTLQPVSLSEGQFRSFFLTAHVTDDIESGLYKGNIALATRDGKNIGSIPVSIKVLPFSLPSPKCYFNPKKDFLTSSYSYISFEMIAEENGGDLALARDQMLATLKNQAEHNQILHWCRGGFAEVTETIEIMKKAGQRTDIVLTGGVGAFNTQIEQDAHARRLAKFYDNLVGHHNVLIGYGDEPGAAWLVQSRPIFEAYQKAGFGFIIAGNNSVFYKAGYLYDWFNSAQNPIDSSATALWNQIDHAYVAWYANMHVGPENPAFNRRQYGMAPYLSNFSAVCNYAHHFGPYNDDSTTYRPMVFAYGSHSGVIDTLQWEGFREGIDDIRYATLLTSLAREASASDDIHTKYAGRTALHFLATFDKTQGDLNACRLEMINHILTLKNRLGK